MKLYCPNCEMLLEQGKWERYETLVDHVSDPNQTDFDFRPTWRCSRKCYGRLAFWDMYGDAYSPYAWWQMVLIKLKLGNLVHSPRVAEAKKESKYAPSLIPAKW